MSSQAFLRSMFASEEESESEALLESESLDELSFFFFFFFDTFFCFLAFFAFFFLSSSLSESSLSSFLDFFSAFFFLTLSLSESSVSSFLDFFFAFFFFSASLSESSSLSARLLFFFFFFSLSLSESSDSLLFLDFFFLRFSFSLSSDSLSLSSFFCFFFFLTATLSERPSLSAAFLPGEGLFDLPDSVLDRRVFNACSLSRSTSSMGSSSPDSLLSFFFDSASLDSALLLFFTSATFFLSSSTSRFTCNLSCFTKSETPDSSLSMVVFNLRKVGGGTGSTDFWTTSLATVGAGTMEGEAVTSEEIEGAITVLSFSASGLLFFHSVSESLSSSALGTSFTSDSSTLIPFNLSNSLCCLISCSLL